MNKLKILSVGKKYVVMLLVLALASICYQSFAALSHLSNGERKRIVYEMYNDYKKKSFPDVQDISPDMAMKLMKSEQVVFVDARTPQERRVSMLPGALSVKEFQKNLNSYRDKTIISYCTISYRSAKLTRKLRDKGFTAYNLEGGLLAWVLEGGKVYDSSGVTKRIHVYGERWDYPPEGYKAVW
ncbi:MAG: rhodanese-like domain-containing protein [Desulfoferrobacter sp.]